MLALTAFGCSKADLSVAPTQSTPSNLQVTAINDQGDPVDSANVFLDGVLVGVTPYSKSNIEPGLHSIRVSEEGFKLFTDQIVAIQGQHYAIEALLTRLPVNEGELVISVNTDSARIRVMDLSDGLLIETSERLSAYMLAPGMYKVTGEKDGLPKVEEAAEILSGKTTTVFLELQAPQNIPSLTFTITEDTVRTGEPINLHWESDGLQVIIDQGVGVRGPNGSEKIICTTPGTKIFTATAFSTTNETTEKSDTVYVFTEDAVPPTLAFEIDADTVEIGQQFELAWQTDGYQVIIDQGVGTRGPSGKEKISCPAPGMKIFTATAYSNENLTTQKQDTVFVVAGTAIPPTLNFSVTQDTVTAGEQVAMEWHSNADHVIIDQGVGLRGPNGSDRITCPTPGLKIFTAIAFGATNLTTEKKDSVYVKARTTVPPTLTFDVIGDSVEVEKAAQLEWQTNGSQVFIDQGVGPRGPFGTEEVVFHSPGLKIFTAVAVGEGNLTTTSKDSIYVKEAPLPPNPVIMLSTTRRVTVNTPANIAWQTQNADYVQVDLVDNPTLEGNVQITFSSPGIRFITATAFNQRGWSSATDTIEVVEPVIEPPVDDILIPASVSVRADRGEEGMVQRAAGIFDIEKAGRYRLHAEVWYNSGDEQRNESYYVDLEDGIGDTKHPIDRNAGVNRVVPDDPGDPHTVSRNSGTFNLVPGAHIINVYHYARIANTYPRFINGQISGAESVKIIGFRLVFLGE